MKKIFVVLVLAIAAAGALAAQAVTPAPAADLPDKTAGVFVSYDAYNLPHVTGGIEVTKLLTTSPYETIGVTKVAFEPLAKPRGAIQTVITFEIEQVVLHSGRFHVLGEVGAGVSTTSTSTSGAFTGGGAVLYQLPNKKFFFDYAKLTGGFEKTAATGTLGRYQITFQKVF